MKELLTNNQTIQSKIYNIRGLQVMLDKDLANFYEIKPTRLREQVNRNIKKFPNDFMFELDDNEINFMVSQNAIPSKQHLGGSKAKVFTEQVVSMLPTVLRSEKAIQISIEIIRTFVEMRKFISQNNYLFKRMELLEDKQKNVDEILNAIESKNTKIKQGVCTYKKSHDRFLILDNKTIYHISASLKDLGNKWFAFSKLEDDNLKSLSKVKIL